MSDPTLPPAAAKQGFSVSFNMFEQERDQALKNDKKTRNVFLKAGTDILTYRVTEEEVGFPHRASLPYFPASKQDNSSLQDVELVITPNRNEATYAALLSTFMNDKERYALRGYADGRVTLHVANIKNSSAPDEYDITEAAAKAGITAACIRDTQKQISYDGEVTRGEKDGPEQEEIIRLVNQARTMVRSR